MHLSLPKLSITKVGAKPCKSALNNECKHKKGARSNTCFMSAATSQPVLTTEEQRLPISGSQVYRQAQWQLARCCMLFL